MSQTRFRLTRRQVLAGLTTASVASVGVGAGVASLDDDAPSSGRDGADGTMTVAVTGSGVAVQPPLVVAPLTGTGSVSRDVRVVNRRGVAAKPALQFWHESTDAADPGRTGDLRVSVAFDGETLREGALRRVFDGTVSVVDRPLAPGDAARLAFDWRLPEDAGGVAASVGVVRLRLGVD